MSDERQLRVALDLMTKDRDDWYAYYESSRLERIHLRERAERAEADTKRTGLASGELVGARLVGYFGGGRDA
jgi:hypothetical protein